MVRIAEVQMFLIVFDLLFQIQEKSRRSISKKGRNARFLKIVRSNTIRNICTSVLILTIKNFVQLLGGVLPLVATTKKTRGDKILPAAKIQWFSGSIQLKFRKTTKVQCSRHHLTSVFSAFPLRCGFYVCKSISS